MIFSVGFSTVASAGLDGEQHWSDLIGIRCRLLQGRRTFQRVRRRPPIIGLGSENQRGRVRRSWNEIQKWSIRLEKPKRVRDQLRHCHTLRFGSAASQR
jgi:hypothetical protein